MKAEDPYWQIQISIAKSIAKEPNPSIMRLNEAIVEEFGYLPDFDLIDFFIETIKKNNKQAAPPQQDPKIELAYSVAISPNPTVPKFCKIFRDHFHELPANDILKFFLVTVRSFQKEYNQENPPVFLIAQKVAKNKDPSFKKLCQQFEEESEKPPSFEIIDYFISQLSHNNKATFT